MALDARDRFSLRRAGGCPTDEGVTRRASPAELHAPFGIAQLSPRYPHIPSRSAVVTPACGPLCVPSERSRFIGTALTRGAPLRYNTAVESPALACVPDTQSSSGRRDDCWHGACHGGLCGATIPWAAARPPPVGWLGWQPVPLRPGVLFPQDCRSRRGPEAVAWSVARVVPAGPTPLCPAGLAIRLG